MQSKNQNNKKKKAICFIIHSLQVGGMERVMSLLIEYFAKTDRYEVHLVLFGSKREIFYNIPQSIIIHKPSFEYNPQKKRRATLKTLLFLRKTIRNIKPFASLSFGEYWNNLVLLSLLFTPYKPFVSDRSKPGKNIGKVQKILRKLLYPKAKGIIAQTSQSEHFARKHKLNRNIRTIPNPIQHIPLDSESNKENIVLFVGRLIKTKNVDRLIQIFAKVENPDWKLYIVGDESQKQKNLDSLRSLVEKLNQTERIFFKGFDKNVIQYYKKAKIFAFPSSSEGFPNVVGEALSAGLPTISYDCIAGPSDMIEDSMNGFLIPLFDDDLFIEKLDILVNDSDLLEKMSQAAKISSENFNTETVCEKYLNFITGHSDK